MHEFVIIADDFTGANDTGVQLSKKGITVQVVLDTEGISAGGESIVVDTESRVALPEEAQSRVEKAVRAVMDKGGCRHLYKKIDSTLRGHLKEEIRAAADIYKPDAVVFTPAYPAQGRVVQGGRVYVHGVPLLDTEIARDPRNPIESDNITDVLSACLGVPAVHYGIDAVERGEIAVEKGAYTFDASEQRHLEEISQAVLASGKKVLWVGAAGLAEGLLSVVCPGRPVLAVVGSISQKTMEQIAYCKERSVSCLCLDMAAVYETGGCDDVVRQAVALLKEGKDVVVTAAERRSDYERFVAYGAEKGLSTDELAECTKRTLSGAALRILQESSVGGLFLTGGDTAIAVIRKLNASGSRIQQEILPGFVQGQICGGPLDGLPVVTKAGAFGSEADIFVCMEKLRQLPQ